MELHDWYGWYEGKRHLFAGSIDGRHFVRRQLRVKSGKEQR